MNIINCLKNTTHNLSRLFVTKRVLIKLSLFHQLAKCAMLYVLHFDKDYLLVLEKLIDFNYIRMV